MGKKIWLSVHPRNFGCDVIVLPFMLAEVKFCFSSTPLVSAINHVAARTFREKKKNNKKAESFFRLNFTV